MDEVEKGEMWAKISELDKKVALNEQSIKVNREKISNIMSEKFKDAESVYQKLNDQSNRSNNIKVAIIGGISLILPTIIVLFAHGGD